MVGCIVDRLHRVAALWLCNRPQTKCSSNWLPFSAPPWRGQNILVNREIALRHVFCRETLLEYRAHPFPSRLSRRETASTASSISFTMNPESSSSITSGTDPDRKAMTGVPQDIASIITSPNGSGQSIGNNNARALPRSLPLALVDLANELDVVMRFDHRRDDVVPVAWSTRSILAAILRAVRRGRQFRSRDPAASPARYGEEREIAAFWFSTEGQEITGQAVINVANPIDASRHRAPLILRNGRQGNFREGAV